MQYTSTQSKIDKVNKLRVIFPCPLGPVSSPGHFCGWREFCQIPLWAWFAVGTKSWASFQYLNLSLCYQQGLDIWNQEFQLDGIQDYLDHVWLEFVNKPDLCTILTLLSWLACSSCHSSWISATRHPVSLKYQLSQLISVVISGWSSSRRSFSTSSLCTSKCRLSSWVPNLPSGSSRLELSGLPLAVRSRGMVPRPAFKCPNHSETYPRQCVSIKLNSYSRTPEMRDHSYAVHVHTSCKHQSPFYSAICKKHEIKLMLPSAIKSLRPSFYLYISWAIKNWTFWKQSCRDAYMLGNVGLLCSAYLIE